MELPVKVINIINRLEAIDRDLMELREMKHNLHKERQYYSTMTIAFEEQINRLLNERVKMMELRIANPPENFLVRSTEGHAPALPAAGELKSPRVEGDKLGQDEADSLVARLRQDSLKRKKNPVVYIQKTLSENPEPVVKKASEVKPSPDDDSSDFKSYKI